jgi:hypothetical protein
MRHRRSGLPPGRNPLPQARLCHKAGLRCQRPLTGANAVAGRVCSRICVRVPEWRLSGSAKRPACSGLAPGRRFGVLIAPGATTADGLRGRPSTVRADWFPACLPWHAGPDDLGPGIPPRPASGSRTWPACRYLGSNDLAGRSWGSRRLPAVTHEDSTQSASSVWRGQDLA